MTQDATNSDLAFDCLAKAYGIPREVLVAQIPKLRNENGSTVTNIALVDWLREQAQKLERGLGYYGNPTHVNTLSEIALFRLCADRLKQETYRGRSNEPIAYA